MCPRDTASPCGSLPMTGVMSAAVAQQRAEQRERIRRSAEEHAWSEEIPDLIPEVLSEVTTPPSPAARDYDGAEYDRIVELQRKIGRAIRSRDALELGTLLLTDARTYCETHVDDAVAERLERLERAGL